MTSLHLMPRAVRNASTGICLEAVNSWEHGTLRPVVTLVKCIVVATGCLAAEHEAAAAAGNAAVIEYHAIHIVCPTRFNSSSTRTPSSVCLVLVAPQFDIEKAPAKAGDFHPCADFVPHMEINPSDSDPFSWAVVRSTSRPIVASRRYARP